MGRPPLDVGTYGVIRTLQLSSGLFESRCKYRDLNGVISRPASRGATEPAAERALKKKLAGMTTVAAKGGITRETRFRKVAELWLEDLEYQAKHGSMSHNTFRTYQSCLKQNVLPRLGALQLREVTVAACDDLIKHTRETMGYESAKKVRTITSAICGLAIRRGAIELNPVRSTEKLTQGTAEQAEVTAMTATQIAGMLGGLRAYAVTKEKDSKGRRQGWRNLVWHDLAELAEAMLATGVRIGEVLAITGEDVVKDDEGKPAVRVAAHLVRVNRQGMALVPGRKGNRPAAILRLPDWSAAMFARRKLASGGGPLFAARDGGWLDASNTASRFRAALDESGFAWVTAHVWRHTVATLLDEAGLSASEIADQLGNTPAVVERHYRKKRVTNKKAAAALESIKPAKAAGN